MSKKKITRKPSHHFKGFDYKRVVTVQEMNDNRLLYDVVIKGDDSGWYRRSDLIPRGSGWSKNYVDKSYITMEYFDGHMVFRIKKPNAPENVFELSMSDLADLRVLIEATRRTGRTKWYPDAKIIAKKELRRKKKK